MDFIVMFFRRSGKDLSIRMILAVILWLLATAGVSAQEDRAQTVIRQNMERLAQAGQLQIGGSDIATVRVLPEFYKRRDYHRAWTSPAAISDLLRAIDDSEKEGLMPRDYHRGALHRLQGEISSTPLPGPPQLADFDVLLSDALLRLGYTLFVGKVDPERLDPNWNLAHDLGDTDPATAIREALDSGDLYQFIESLKPRHRYYTKLKEALASYRAIAAAGGWELLPEGETLKKGESDERVPLLRKRLAVTCDLPDTASADSKLFDEGLEAAVKQFQERHHLAADGVVGKGTRKALNVPVGTRIGQIRVNLERGRWVLQNLEDSFVIVNIAGFWVSYIKEGKMEWRSRAQVGKSYRKTPVFKSKMSYIVFNPTWTVPPTILAQDILPAVKRDSAYLQKKNIEIVDRNGQVVDPAGIEWSKYSGKNFPYILRQKPGPNNALGQVKFIFPNKHFVFLHDTPSKALFERETRTFSSGCIRVEKPLELAGVLLDDPVKWNQESIADLIERGQTKTIYLREPLPVLLLYWTAMVDEKERVNFINDVYERDPAILEDLNAGVRPRRRDLPGRSDKQ
jgi:murein L,D-transpeptidase YcbB/YkuD